MFWTKTFIPTLKQNPQEAESAGHQLLLRAGLARMLMAGVYSYLPLGLMVLNNIEEIIRKEMFACGGAELLLPALQPLELWQKTGRDKDIGEVMIKFTDRRGRDLVLGPTHEEVVTAVVASGVSSYRQLPLLLYQIQTKFRDEIRPRFGLVRACEFIMKDAYSFDRDEAGLDKIYKLMHQAYKNIFDHCGLRIVTTEADSGVMGGKVSHEFMVPAKDGEDAVLVCPKCNGAVAYKEGAKTACVSCGVEAVKTNAIEIGHIFKLGTKYTAPLGANFLDADSKQKPIIMGCYGIGVSRLISAVIEQNNDKDGIIWPKDVAPFKVIVLPLETEEAKIMETALEVYNELKSRRIAVLLDDRDERPGVKFKDADLLGIPLQVVVGKKNMQNNQIELKMRRSGEKSVAAKSEILRKIEDFLNG